MRKIVYIIILLSVNLFAQNTYHAELDWYTLKGKHVYVHFHQGTERTARAILKIADEVWDPITSLYEYEPEPTHYIVKDVDDYSNGATYFFDNKIEIWASSLDFDLRGSHNWLRNVISHEFTHMVQIQSALKFSRKMPVVYLQYMNYDKKKRPDILYEFPNGIVSYPIPGINVPSWMAEGTAQYMRKEFGYDDWDTHRDMILRCYALDGNMISWTEMGVFGKTSLGNESVYNAGFAFTRYISQRFGEDKLREITRNLGKWNVFTVDKAIEMAVGIDGQELYNQWKKYLAEDYSKRILNVKNNLVEGNKIYEQGFGNFYPVFSPDNSKIAFISNKESDYFRTNLYFYDLKTKNVKQVAPLVRSNVSWFPDGKKMLYAKLTDNNKDLVLINDIYTFDILTEKETRITKGLRANHPCLSDDGSKIAFVFQKDGTTNLGIVDSDGKNFIQLTAYKYGEQIYNPKFSKDGKNIIFDYSFEKERDILSYNLEDKKISEVVKTSYDERNPVYDTKGNIIYCSNKTGIFNIYKYNLMTKETKQLTNVLGGAFYPAVDTAGNISYAGYTSSGYKLYYISKSEQQKVEEGKTYIVRKNPPLDTVRANGDMVKFNLNKLQHFNDYELPDVKKEPLKGVYSSNSFFPLLRIDNYQTTNNFLDRIKPGVYFLSTDILNRYQFFLGAAVNKELDRDLVFQFEYKNKLPLISKLGLKPVFTFEIYNISRTTDADLFIDQQSDGSYAYKAKTQVNYDLIEGGISLKHYLINTANQLEFKYTFSNYFSNIDAFPNPVEGHQNETILGMREAYFKGYTLQANYSFNVENDYRDGDISPEKASLEFKYSYESSSFNPDYELDDNGNLNYEYQKNKFSRLELNLENSMRIYGSHTLGVKVKGSTIIDKTMPDFFDSYLGGLIGMKSFPFYAISGNEMAWLNLYYRFPILRDIDKQLSFLYVDKIFGSLYFDYGYAWNGNLTKNVLDDFKKGIGGELRVKLHSFYMFPTALFFDAAYSFDRYTRVVHTVKPEYINYGKEWQFYFGMLFDFSF